MIHCVPWLQIREAGKLEAVGGLDLISLNALTAVLASADRLGEAEETLQKASALAASKGVLPFGGQMRARSCGCGEALLPCMAFQSFYDEDFGISEKEYDSLVANRALE